MIKKIILILFLLLSITSWSPEPKKWVAIGDSITYLNDHLDETGHRVKKGYLTRVTESLPNLQYINKGYNGWTSGRIANQITELDIPEADIYTIFLGTNDWWVERPVGTEDDYMQDKGNKTIYGSFRIIINYLRGLNNKAKIILITPLQRGDFVYINDHNNNAHGSYMPKNGQDFSQIADAIKRIGEIEDLPVIDLYNDSKITLKNMVKFKRLKDPKTNQYKEFRYPDYIGIPYDSKNDEYPYPEKAIDMTYDGLHPSDKGNEIIAKMLIKEFKKSIY
ncbi:SGNH/GDSL hydrolase family protein [Prevotella sp. 10(H)]|uniref:SGNH/GDSL hydrolase family protein n=1 Tax=Prevotella sp. 10(H) TaxID=1158294 RepID=UPI0004A707F0|nr:SGNH/GDSL hydrolase family protein [Prevotella sp. 10(H)]